MKLAEQRGWLGQSSIIEICDYYFLGPALMGL